MTTKSTTLEDVNLRRFPLQIVASPGIVLQPVMTKTRGSL